MSHYRWQRLFSAVAVASMVVTTTMPVGAAYASPVSGPSTPSASFGKTTASVRANFDNTPATYIIQFVAPPAALYTGDIAGLEATNPQVTGAHKLNVKDAAVTAYRNYLASQRTQALAAMENVTKAPLDILYVYDLAYNGVAVKLTPSQAAQIAKLPTVRQVEREKIYQLETDAGPNWIGASGIWDGSATGTATKGEGIVAGVIDTGINSDNPSFADIGGDGYDHTNPLGSGNYVGYCVANPSFCNDKLIGAWAYPSLSPTPEDADGHGSHTASTVAGNVTTATVAGGGGAFITTTISGVAPHANIIAYAACCTGAALLAAINQIISDSVDVVNYSIGPTAGESNPYTDSNMQGFLAATAAGIYVSVSAGNSGPGAATVGNTAPWVTIVGSSTHNRAVLNSVINMNGTAGSPPADILGQGLTNGYGPARIVYAGNAPYNNPLCNPFPGGTFSGEIVVCDRGTIGRVQKSINVQAAGGGGFVLVNDAASSASLLADPFAVPGTAISFADGQPLKTWLSGGGVYTASIAGYTLDINSAYGDKMSSFSSRGPSTFVPDTIVPSIAAPGHNIIAAYKDPEQFNLISGTSMASPHNAGAAALLRALHPTWTPLQVKSALMSAAHPENMIKENGITTADIFDYGSGRINVSDAANAGFVLNETQANFTAANPATGGNPALLNLASVAQDACIGICTWTRTLRSVWSVPVTWTTSYTGNPNVAVTVSPAVFTINPGATQVITITADVSAITSTTTWNFGQVDFSPAVGFAPVISTYTSSPNLTIADNTSVTDTLTVADTAPILDVNVIVSATHTFLGDLEVKLISPNATTVMLIDEPLNGTGSCSGNDLRSIVLNDDPGGTPGTSVQTACTSGTNPTQAYAAGGSYTPATPLTVLDGGTLAGNWDLSVTDFAGGDTGVLQSWSVVVQYGSASATPPSDAHFPLAVKASTGSAPSAINITAYANSGTYTVTDIQAAPITDFQTGEFGLTQATVHTENLIEDPTNANVYNNDGGTYYVTVTVPAGARRLVGEIVSSTSLDVDLYYGLDADNDGPEASEELGFSATGAVLEYLSIDDPTPGTYWFLAQNWSAGSASDPVSLAYVAVPSTASSNLTVNGPATQPGGVPFTITVDWNEPTMAALEYWYGGFDLGTDAGNPANIGTTTVDLVRTSLPEIDVTPTELTSAQPPDTVITHTLTIANSGVETLNWSIQESAPLAGTEAAVQGGSASFAGSAETVGSPDVAPTGATPASNFPTTIASPSAVLYNSGPVVSNPGGGPGGGDGSVLQNVALGMNILGYSVADAAGLRLADVFTIPGPNSWHIDSFRFYAYQTGAVTPTSTLDVANLQIWNGVPGTGAVVYGDATTNILAATAWSGAYRYAENAVGGTRGVMSATASVSVTLAPGTYWVDWQLGGTLASGPFAPPITIPGVLTTGMAIQSNSPAWTAFAPLTMTATGIPAITGVRQGMPFVIQGTEIATVGCGTSIPWVSATPTGGSAGFNESDNVSVVFDSTGLANGVYTGTLCVNSNDADEAQILVPLTLTVEDAVPNAVTVVADPMTNTINSTTYVTATVWDQFSMPMAGEPVTFTVSNGDVVAVGQPFVAWLDGTQENPPSGSSSTGVITFTMTATGALDYVGSATGLSATVTAAHIHIGEWGVNGPVEFPLLFTDLGGGNASFAGTTPALSAAQWAAYLHGDRYANVHTSAAPGGEIRGQLWTWTNAMGEAYVWITRATAGTATVAAEVGFTGISGSTDAYFVEPPPNVTFVYHDLEDVVHVGESLHLAGAFNGWPAPGVTMTADANNDVFTVTLPIAAGNYDYKFQVYNGTTNWDWVNTNNRNITVTVDATVTEYRNVVVGYARLFGPASISITLGSPTGVITGDVWINSVTDPAGAGRGVWAQLGYGVAVDPSLWGWSDMTYDTNLGNNDVFMGVVTPTLTGVYSYAVRYDGNWGVGNPNAAWTYGDLNGSPFSIDQAGVLTVNASGYKLYLPLIAR